MKTTVQNRRSSDKGIIGLKKIPLFSANDNRGEFIKPFSANFQKKYSFNKNLEIYYSFSKKNVFRGFHLQKSKYDCAKIVTCSMGKIFDVVVDLRPGSPTYLNIVTTILSEKSDFSLLIPKGCAHGYFCLGKNNLVHYIQNQPFHEKYYTGFHYSSFPVRWPPSFSRKIISDKDQNLEIF